MIIEDDCGSFAGEQQPKSYVQPASLLGVSAVSVRRWLISHCDTATDRAARLKCAEQLGRRKLRGNPVAGHYLAVASVTGACRAGRNQEVQIGDAADHGCVEPG